MDSPLTPELITELLQNSRRKQNYRESVESFIGRKLTDDELVSHKILTKAQIRRRVPRADRIRAIMVKRYNVPESLVDALIAEFRDIYY